MNKENNSYAIEEETENFKDVDINDIDGLRVVEHFIGHCAVDMLTKTYSIKRFITPGGEADNIIKSIQMLTRKMMGVINAIANLFGKDERLFLPRYASYNIEKFFTNIAAQMNSYISLLGPGEVVFELDHESEYSASFDPVRVSSIIYHLVSNSLQHGKTDNKIVKIKCKKVGDMFEITVIDHGGGVPKSVQSTMYTKFLEEHSIKKQRLGMFPPIISGLGLPLCKKFAEDMKGELSFRNIAGGARFIVSIPQDGIVLREEREYLFDDTLMLGCMAYLRY